jgi:hypothetical protein
MARGTAVVVVAAAEAESNHPLAETGVRVAGLAAAGLLMATGGVFLVSLGRRSSRRTH